MRHRSSDTKAFQEPVGHSILDDLPSELIQTAADFFDEKSLVNFFISCLGSVRHQYRYNYAKMARRLVKKKFAALQKLLHQPRPVGSSNTPPTIPPAVIQFVDEYAANIDRQDEEQRVAGILDVTGGNPAALQDDDADELEAIMDLQSIVQAIHRLSGRLAVLHYFRDTLQKNTNHDILWPVWYGKFQLQADRVPVAPSAVISTPIWYPSLLHHCKHAFVPYTNRFKRDFEWMGPFEQDYFSGHHQRDFGRTSPFGRNFDFIGRRQRDFDFMGRLEQGFPFLLATVTGMSSMDVAQLLDLGDRLRGECTDVFHRMAVVNPARALDRENHIASARRMPLAQYERVVEQEGNGQLYCFWKAELEESEEGESLYVELTELIVELLIAQRSVQLLSNLPEN